METKIFLETERLVLRRFNEDDVDNLFLLDNDPEVMRLTRGGKPTDQKIERNIIINEIIVKLLDYYRIYENYGFWAVIRKQDDIFIGWFHFRPMPDNTEEIDLGYRFVRSAWGNGYATEGSCALIEKGFNELTIKKVSARALPQNKASIRVMEKAGMSFEKRIRDSSGIEMVQYSVEKDFFIAHRAQRKK